MNIEELKKDMEKGDFLYKGSCHDCGKHVEVNVKLSEKGEMSIEGGAVYKIKTNQDTSYFFKCDVCYKLDSILHNWQECEVYSRCVGYLRPVQQYNKGKLEEFKQRKLFKI